MDNAADPGTLVADGAELTLELGPRIAPLLQGRIAGLAERAPAELTFGNLWLFRQAHRWRFHEGRWPFISGISYDGQPHALPLFKLSSAPAPVLHDLLVRHGCIFPLREDEMALLDGSRFRFASNRNDADYLYPAEQFRQYRGRALQKKRNLMAQLQTAHALFVQTYTTALREEALQVLEGWMHDKHKQPGETDDGPCREALALAPQLGLEGFLYRASGEVAGFLLAQELQPGVWVVRFAKGLVRFKGIAQFMFHHFASRPDRKVDWLNFEQDLGLPNFRRTKLSYRPATLLPKWRLLP
ncbi:MAG: hypothetical protein JWQ07_4639 [Ramlibacter sp.]|nr:hypothetical protein [Ramlibacter sp.]